MVKTKMVSSLPNKVHQRHRYRKCLEYLTQNLAMLNPACLHRSAQVLLSFQNSYLNGVGPLFRAVKVARMSESEMPFRGRAAMA